MAAAWSRRFLIGAELPPCNLIGAPSHMTPLPYLLSAAESLLLPSFSPAPQFPVATFSQPLLLTHPKPFLGFSAIWERTQTQRLQWIMIRDSAHARENHFLPCLPAWMPSRRLATPCRGGNLNLPLQVTSLPSPSLSSLPEPLHRRPTMPCHACSNQFSPCNVVPVCYSRPTMFMFQPPSTMFSVSSSLPACLCAKPYQPYPAPTLQPHRCARPL